jgi:diguanylate cyclase (GGDEF)-like protein
MFDADDLLDDTPRRKFEQTLAKRCREGDSFALMLVELERFSEVSKSSGRQAGDLLLYEIASRLRDKLGERDMVMRRGSNEFAVLALGVQQIGDAERLAEQLVERLEHPIFVAGTRFRLSASIGITLFPQHGDEWRLLLQHANEALYDAKAPGRGRISITFAAPK